MKAMSEFEKYSFPWKVTGETYEGHIVVRWFRNKDLAQKWAAKELLEVWRIEFKEGNINV